MSKPVDLLFLVVLAYFYAQSTNCDSCFTPSQTLGQCVSIRHCPAIINVLKDRPLTREIAEYLRTAHCGFEGLNAKVCCVLHDQSSNIPLQGSYTSTISSYEHRSTPPSLLKKSSDDLIRSSLLPNKNECGQPSGEHKIFGGAPVSLFDFPWMALIQYRTANSKSFYCGGALISERYVLTAAHCVKGRDLPSNAKIVSVRLGEYNLATDPDCSTHDQFKVCSDKAIDIPVVNRITHKNYRPFDVNRYHDIALLKLAANVNFTDFIQPICLPVFDDLMYESFAGTNATVAGWGRTENSSLGSNVKLAVEVPIHTHQECVKTYSSTKLKPHKEQICSGGENGKDSCEGDSGGPLMSLYSKPGEINWYITGITSFGPGKCGTKGWPAIYTRVTEYIPWILKNIKRKVRKTSNQFRKI